MADITDEEQQAADNLVEIANYNANSVLQQLQDQLGIYDQSDAYNKGKYNSQNALASAKTAAAAFNQNRSNQLAFKQARDLSGTAMNSSLTDDLASAYSSLLDSDRTAWLSTLRENKQDILDSYNDSMQENALARQDLASDANYNIRSLNSNLAANLNNINADLYASPGTGSAAVEGTDSDMFDTSQYAYTPDSTMSGYIYPTDAARTSTQKAGASTASNYFNQLLNSYSRATRRTS